QVDGTMVVGHVAGGATHMQPGLLAALFQFIERYAGKWKSAPVVETAAYLKTLPPAKKTYGELVRMAFRGVRPILPEAVDGIADPPGVVRARRRADVTPPDAVDEQGRWALRADGPRRHGRVADEDTHRRYVPEVEAWAADAQAELTRRLRAVRDAPTPEPGVGDNYAMYVPGARGGRPQVAPVAGLHRHSVPEADAVAEPTVDVPQADDVEWSDEESMVNRGPFDPSLCDDGHAVGEAPRADDMEWPDEMASRALAPSDDA
ncbi:MAG TPA: hypothetical protein VKD22_15600, partial [Ramlibacter sp.]|nr:hypothetical protein [Ramlibacter sp.]